jgi:hypothetical protein
MRTTQQFSVTLPNEMAALDRSSRLIWGNNP